MPDITKRRVTMRTYVAAPSATPGKPTIETHEAVDYVTPDILDAYVTNARTRWQEVTVSDEPDAGPGGYHGATHVPHEIDHPDAGTTRPASED